MGSRENNHFPNRIHSKLALFIMANFQGDTFKINGVNVPIIGGSADDMINARTNGNDTVNGGLKDDKIYISKGNDAYNGGDGTDTLSAHFFDEYVNVDLTDGTVNTGYQEESTAIGFENYQGAAEGAYTDIVRGTDEDNTISTYGGDDTVHLTRGNDIYNAGDGVDTLNAAWFPSEGVDQATVALFNMETGFLAWTEENGNTHVGEANDFESYLGIAGIDTVIGNADDNFIHTYNGDDLIYLS